MGPSASSRGKITVFRSKMSKKLIFTFENFQNLYSHGKRHGAMFRNQKSLFTNHLWPSFTAISRSWSSSGHSETTPTEYPTLIFYYGKILLFSLARSIWEGGIEMTTSLKRIRGQVQAANGPEAGRTSPRRMAIVLQCLGSSH